MANKARYYGLAKTEQKDMKKRASETPFINVEELTPWTVYSVLALYPTIDASSSQTATRRMKEELIKNGFNGKIEVSGSSISDGANTYVLTKTSSNGIMIVKETHEEKRRKR